MAMINKKYSPLSRENNKTFLSFHGEKVNDNFLKFTVDRFHLKVLFSYRNP